MELDVKTQVDFEKGIVDLNPPGRRQNKKVRPIVRLTENLKGWLLHCYLAKPIVLRDEIVKQINPKTFEGIAIRAGVPELTRYTLRRYMRTRARRLPEHIRPSREECATFMGHTDPEFRTTEKFYEVYDPCYLINVAKATDEIMLILDQKCSRSLFSPNQRPDSGLVLMKSPLINNA
jgi:integrase